jgi:hypothetical protein
MFRMLQLLYTYGASGVVLGDHEGKFCGGGTKWYDHCLNALATEATACQDGIQYAREQGVVRLQLEHRLSVFVKPCDNRLNQNSDVGPILQQIHDLSRSFVDFNIVFSNRNCNSLAHECAKLVSRNNLVEEWLERPPSLRGILETDCNHVHDQ